MPVYPTPIEDEENPCYCPRITAVSYLQSLRRPLSQKDKNSLKNQTRHPKKSARFARMLSQAHHELKLSPQNQNAQMPSFLELLNESMNEEDLLILQTAAHSASSRQNLAFSSPSLGTSTSFAPSWEKKSGSRLLPRSTIKSRPGKTSPRPIGRDLPGSRASTAFSDLQGPPKHGRSSMSVNDESFELSAKADRLNFFPRGRKSKPHEWFSPYGSIVRGRHVGTSTASETRRKMRKLEDELYGPPIGTESPRGLKSLISRIDALLPGVRLKEKLFALDASSHQRIADVLSMDGSLNTRILNLLRMSELECIDLTASMTDAEGLNLDSQQLLHVFAKPNSFLFLNEMNLSGAKLEDSDLIHIHHLPRLARLWISNTGIGNEAIYLLVPLKRSLTELDIAFNPAVTDDAIPALLILHKLRFLTVLNTGIGMPGLRAFCAAIVGRKHSMELEVPRECEIYVERMGRQYLLQPETPLISDPSLVSELSTNAIKRNLMAHAEHNPTIIAEGSKAEMAVRLKTLLELRAADLVVREVLWKGDVNEEDQEEEEREEDAMDADEDDDEEVLEEAED
ncbi:hypothetical protein BXZ70DRAFT_79817 [Cristinia sonorae]|uniref:Uncharacterized protein n=1 Tax=Cristinia sonorae TaxID=1940300 RepID=A0A8K0XR12_9AGAR|nr:hypothetical protein BXZ70DRAFT_79817 [Cristinia sonorae]